MIIRILARASLYFVLCVFVAPSIQGAITRSDVSIEIYSWASWLVWIITFVSASALQEFVLWLLTRKRSSE
jgi:hypothetical protein